jgi:ankyrin repeat protein
MLASSSGSLESVKCLIKLGANISYTDERGYNLIHLAAHRNHANIIDYFIINPYPQIDTWKILINMLSSENDLDIQASVKSLLLLTNMNKKFCKAIIDAGGVHKLCGIIRSFSDKVKPTIEKDLGKSSTKVAAEAAAAAAQKEKQRIAKMNAYKEFLSSDKIHTASNFKQKETITLDCLSVLCNISDEKEVKLMLNSISDVDTILLNILDFSANEDMQSRACILLGDIASLSNDVRVELGKKGSLPKLLKQLKSDKEDLLVNATNTLEIICKENEDNQVYCCENGILESFLYLIKLDSGKIINILFY